MNVINTHSYCEKLQNEKKQVNSISKNNFCEPLQKQINANRFYGNLLFSLFESRDALHRRTVVRLASNMITIIHISKYAYKYMWEGDLCDCIV